MRRKGGGDEVHEDEMSEERQEGRREDRQYQGEKDRRRRKLLHRGVREGEAFRGERGAMHQQIQGGGGQKALLKALWARGGSVGRRDMRGGKKGQ